MKRQLTISPDPIDEHQLLQGREFNKAMGAVVYFLGIVRATEAQQQITGLEYEAFLEMAQHQFELLFDQMETRWPVESVRLVHRTGFVKAGAPSLWIEIVAPHRGEALAACEWLIDQMKRVVPIWKKPVAQKPERGG